MRSDSERSSDVVPYDWWAADLDREQQKQVSPRKLEHIGILLEQELNPKTVINPLTNLPFEQLQARLTDKEGVLDVKDFLSDPDGFARIVEHDMNVAVRFAHLLPGMKPGAMCTARDITLSLPTELLASLHKQCPFVFKKTHEAIRKIFGEGEADAFRDLIADRVGATCVQKR
ncbi:MAG: hypothetical protein Q7J98_13330 [Kiritimatiellia bacterium]|nr:hypothetical protein [Kiritimatiellia bacterium]